MTRLSYSLFQLPVLTTRKPQDGSAQNGAMRMYWNVFPTGNRTGGILYSCVYEVFNGTCYQES